MRDQYLIIVEPANDGNYSAYLPDVPGCVACEDNVEEVKASIQEALDFHLDGLNRAGPLVPEPTCHFFHKPISKH